MPTLVGWSISFVGVSYDFPLPGQSTWTYTVQATGSGPSVRGLSHLVFGLCTDLFASFVSGTITPDPGTDWSVYVEPNEPSGCDGVKFDSLSIDANPAETWIFTFVLDAKPPAGDVCLTVSAGSSVAVGTITGPICTGPTPGVDCPFAEQLCVDFSATFTVSAGEATVVRVTCEGPCPTGAG